MLQLRHALCSPRTWTRRGVRKTLTLLLGLPLLAYMLFVFLGTNWHTVIDGKVYRSSQLSGDTLAEYLRNKQVKTVINLRGYCPDFEWYRDEVTTTSSLGVSQEDITFSANRLLPPTELKRLIDVFDKTEYPIVLHCKQGADRTGLASAIVLLLYTNASLERARRELLPHRGHFPVARTAAMDDFLDRYEAWLNGRNHEPALFRDWAFNIYVAGPAKAEFTWLTPIPAVIPANKPFALTLQATNRSTDPWRFTAGSTSGIHLVYCVYDEKHESVLKDQAGLLNRVVAPSESIDLTLAFPKLAPGRYALRAEMADFTGAAVPVRAQYFYQFGDPFVQAELIVK
ncbi:hypothetical protein BH11PLA2_BH11PLA2_48980 [soil metagenome]